MAIKKVDNRDRVTIKIDRIPGQKNQDDVIVEVNGNRWQIQRGIEVNVPRVVASALRQWRREQDEAERIEFELMDN